MVIRPATPSDVAALSDLAKRTWSDAFGYSVSAAEEAAELEEKRSEAYFVEALRESKILLAETDAVLTGYVQFGDAGIRGVVPGPGDQELHRIYVETEMQGRGVGRSLLNAALQHPRLADASRIFLQVWERNEQAIGLYESLGFRTVGKTAFTIGSGEVAQDLVMVLDRENP